MPRRWENNFCVPARRLAPIIEQSVGLVLRLSSLQEWVSVEEADESVFWLELLSETGVVCPERTQDLLNEANELVKIFGASLRTSKHGVK
jgi:hypothetical protein